jgi:hypothetical protein
VLRIPRGQRRSDETTLRPHAIVLFLFGSWCRNQRSRLVRCARPTTARTLWPRRRGCRRGALSAELPLCCLVQVHVSTRFSGRVTALQCKSVLADGRWMAARWPEPGLSTSVRALLRASYIQRAPISPVVCDACTCTAQQAPGPLPGSSKCLLT